jgi:lysophospholipase L1-like esterase
LVGEAVRSPGPASWRSRAALVIGGVVFTLVLMEVGLQAAAFVVRQTSARSAATWRGAAGIRLLALGDSNTYAWGIEESQAYPEVLEREWNSDPTRPRLEVINLGFPGTNSSQLRNRLPQLLTMLRPDFVTVMVGVNDFWTVPEPVGDDTDWRQRLDSALWRHSRLYRLVWMLRRSLQAKVIDIPRTASRSEDPIVVQVGEERVAWHLQMRPSGQQLPGAPLQENLAAMAGQAHAAGAELVLLTYPADIRAASIYRTSNQRIRRAAADLGVPLIDLGPSISGHCTAVPCDTLRSDRHPTVLGHQRAGALVAEALADHVARAH